MAKMEKRVSALESLMDSFDSLRGEKYKKNPKEIASGGTVLRPIPSGEEKHAETDVEVPVVDEPKKPDEQNEEAVGEVVNPLLMKRSKEKEKGKRPVPVFQAAMGSPKGSPKKKG